MFRPRRLIWLALFVGIGYAIWRWRQSQAIELSVPSTLPPPTRATPPVLGDAAAADAPSSGPRRIVTRVHRGAPPAVSPITPPRAALASAPEEPPPAPSEPPATHEQSLAPLTPEEVTSSHAEPEPPAVHEDSLAPLAPEEAPEEAPAGPVNVNTADLQTLIDIPGIGRAIATRIITRREQQGPFATIDELVEIQGIGPVSLGEFRHLITV